jgi:dephospho-CoA kinase
MLVVGLTGGIGAGKSTLAALLAERGAQVIDADAFGRAALRPGQPAWHSVVDQFGEEILSPGTMQIDRKRLADVVFNDHRKLAALNAIVHPVIFKNVADSLERLRNTETIVVLDAALVVETGLDEAVDALIVVTSPQSTRKDRLERERGMSLADIGARMASQRDPAELIAKADIVVENKGTLDDLGREADRVWAELSRMNESQ